MVRCFPGAFFRFLSPFPPGDPRHYCSQRRTEEKPRIKKISRFWSGTGFGGGGKYNLSVSLELFLVDASEYRTMLQLSVAFGGGFRVAWLRVWPSVVVPDGTGASELGSVHGHC
jgi:hypothetical protein